MDINWLNPTPEETAELDSRDLEEVLDNGQYSSIGNREDKPESYLDIEEISKKRYKFPVFQHHKP